MAAMTTHPGAARVQEGGCACLHELCLASPELQLKAVAAGAMPTVVALISEPTHSSPAFTPPLRAYACLALAQLCQPRPGATLSAPEGVVPALQSVLLCHAEEAPVVGAACLALAAVAHDPQLRHVALSGGCVPALLRAATACAVDARVQERACGALRALLRGGTAAPMPAGCVDIVLSAADAHPDCPGVQLAATEALRTLLTHFGASAVRASTTRAPDAALASAACRPGAAPELVCAAAEAYASLVESPGAAQRAVAAGEASAFAALLAAAPRPAAVQGALAAVLGTLAAALPAEELCSSCNAVAVADAASASAAALLALLPAGSAVLGAGGAATAEEAALHFVLDGLQAMGDSDHALVRAAAAATALRPTSGGAAPPLLRLLALAAAPSLRPAMVAAALEAAALLLAGGRESGIDYGRRDPAMEEAARLVTATAHRFAAARDGGRRADEVGSAATDALRAAIAVHGLLDVDRKPPLQPRSAAEPATLVGRVPRSALKLGDCVLGGGAPPRYAGASAPSHSARPERRTLLHSFGSSLPLHRPKAQAVSGHSSRGRVSAVASMPASPSQSPAASSSSRAHSAPQAASPPRSSASGAPHGFSPPPRHGTLHKNSSLGFHFPVFPSSVLPRALGLLPFDSPGSSPAASPRPPSPRPGPQLPQLSSTALAEQHPPDSALRSPRTASPPRLLPAHDAAEPAAPPSVAAVVLCNHWHPSLPVVSNLFCSRQVYAKPSVRAASAAARGSRADYLRSVLLDCNVMDGPDEAAFRTESEHYTPISQGPRAASPRRMQQPCAALSEEPVVASAEDAARVISFA